MNLDNIWKVIKKKKNVKGISENLQYKIKDGKKTSKLSVRIYVTRKEPMELLLDKDIIPTYVEVDEQIYETDVVEHGEINALSVYQNKHRPLVAGISIGHRDVTAGTLGYFVIKDGRTMILSNNHVLANTNKANRGDAILQPGKHDGGSRPADICGHFYGYVEIKFTEFQCPIRNFLHKFYRVVKSTKTNEVDMAVCTMIVDHRQKLLIDNWDNISVMGIEMATKGMECIKSGRTTGHTKGGIVIDTAYRGMVNYLRGIAEFKNQLLIEKEGFSAGGDSGSLILSKAHKAVGLLFAGSDTHTVANKIQRVEEIGKVEICGRSS